MTLQVVSKQSTLKQSRPGNRQGREKRGHRVSSVRVLLQAAGKEGQLRLHSRNAELKFPKHLSQKCTILAL